MANFVFLYHGGEMPEGEDAQKKMMDAWMAWFGQLGDSMVDGGNPIAPGAKKISGEGAVSDAGSDVTGYTVIKADSMAEAVEKAKSCPIGAGASMTVHETVQMGTPH